MGLAEPGLDPNLLRYDFLAGGVCPECGEQALIGV